MAESEGGAQASAAAAPHDSDAALEYSVVVPVFNEAANIGAFCRAARDQLPGRYELLICYDFDADSTLPALANLPESEKPQHVRLVKNDLGKGVRYAIEAGMRAADAPVVLVTMADLSDDFSSVKEMIVRAAAGAEVVSGSRYMPGGRQIGGPKFKSFLSRTAGLSLRWLTGLPTHDPTNSFKAYRKQFLDRTPIESTAGFCLGLELTVKSHFSGGRVEEVPATWQDRTAGKSRFKLMQWLPKYLHWYLWAIARNCMRNAVWMCFLAAAFLYALSVWVPWRTPYPPNNDLDSSWMLALKWAHVHGLDFGHEFVFTFGPWGYAIQGYEPATFGSMVAVWTFLTIAFFFAVVVLAKHLTRDGYLAGLCTMLILCITGGGMGQIHDVRLFSLCWILLALHFYVDRRPIGLTKVLLVVAIALASQIKFSVNLMALIALAVISVDQILHRRIPWLAAIYAAAYLGFWELAGQHLSSLPAYLSHSMAISAGYAQGEGFDAPTEVADVLMFLGCAAGLLALVVLHHWKQWRAAALGLAAVAGCLFLAFKAGYVRHDEHEWEGTVGVAVIALIWSAALWPRLKMAGKVLAAVCVTGGLALSWYSYLHWEKDDGLINEMYKTFTAIPDRAHTAWTWLEGDCDWKPEYEHLMSDIRQRLPLPPIQGSVDVYPWSLDSVLANGLDYRPRPVIQSYLTYTSQLGELNAQHLLTPQAADNILFDMGTIGWFPSQNDALSWPLLLTRYDLTDASGSMLLLHRALQPRDYQMVPLKDGQARFRDVIPVPSDGHMVWVKLDINKTLWGGLMNTLYKPTTLVIETRLRSGEVGRAILVPEVASGGFLLSPFVIDRQSFALLASSNWQNDLARSAVTSMTIGAISSTGESACYQSDFHFSFYDLQFPHRDLSAVPGIADYLAFDQFLCHIQLLSAQIKPQVAATDIGRVLLVANKTQMRWRFDSPAATVHVAFGMPPQAFAGDNKSNGMTFRIFAVRPSGQGTVIFSRKLDPANDPADRGRKTGDADIPAGSAGLILETEPVTPQGPNIGYWSQCELR